MIDGGAGSQMELLAVVENHKELVLFPLLLHLCTLPFVLPSISLAHLSTLPQCQVSLWTDWNAFQQQRTTFPLLQSPFITLMRAKCWGTTYYFDITPYRARIDIGRRHRHGLDSLYPLVLSLVCSLFLFFLSSCAHLWGLLSSSVFWHSRSEPCLLIPAFLSPPWFSVESRQRWMSNISFYPGGFVSICASVCFAVSCRTRPLSGKAACVTLVSKPVLISKVFFSPAADWRWTQHLSGRGVTVGSDLCPDTRPLPLFQCLL